MYTRKSCLLTPGLAPPLPSPPPFVLRIFAAPIKSISYITVEQTTRSTQKMSTLQTVEWYKIPTPQNPVHRIKGHYLYLTIVLPNR